MIYSEYFGKNRRTTTELRAEQLPVFYYLAMMFLNCNEKLSKCIRPLLLRYEFRLCIHRTLLIGPDSKYKMFKLCIFCIFTFRRAHLERDSFTYRCQITQLIHF